MVTITTAFEAKGSLSRLSAPTRASERPRDVDETNIKGRRPSTHPAQKETQSSQGLQTTSHYRSDHLTPVYLNRFVEFLLSPLIARVLTLNKHSCLYSILIQPNPIRPKRHSKSAKMTIVIALCRACEDRIDNIRHLSYRSVRGRDDRTWYYFNINHVHPAQDLGLIGMCWRSLVDAGWHSNGDRISCACY
ncbi:hypothetical protein VTK26DRAFT_2397 [Humicola hyalothermophila]